jgi:hypothetical protein
MSTRPGRGERRETIVVLWAFAMTMALTQREADFLLHEGDLGKDLASANLKAGHSG